MLETVSYVLRSEGFADRTFGKSSGCLFGLNRRRLGESIRDYKLLLVLQRSVLLPSTHAFAQFAFQVELPVQYRPQVMLLISHAYDLRFEEASKLLQLIVRTVSLVSFDGYVVTEIQGGNYMVSIRDEGCLATTCETYHVGYYQLKTFYAGHGQVRTDL